MSSPARSCPDASDVGNIFGFQGVALTHGGIDSSGGIVAIYEQVRDALGRARETAQSERGSFKVSIFQAETDDTRIASIQRLHDSLVEAEPIDVRLSGEVDSQARYLRHRNSAWLMARSATTFTYVHVRIPGPAFDQERAARDLRSVIALLGV